MFFIANAYAQTAPAAQPGAESSLMSIGFMVLIFVVFYFLLIRPQVKRQKEHKTMVEALNKGDEVVTAGGIVGKITDIADQYITLQVASVNGAAGPPVDAARRRPDAAAQGHRQVALRSGRPSASVSRCCAAPPMQLSSGRAPGRPKPGPLISSTECTCDPQGRVHEGELP